MKYMNAVKKYGRKALVSGGAIAAGVGGLAMQAYAELPASMATDAASAKADSNELGYLVLGVLFGIAALRWLRRAM